MPQSHSDDLAVLFADIVESTALYRSLGDIDALKIINAYENNQKAIVKSLVQLKTLAEEKTRTP